VGGGWWVVDDWRLRQAAPAIAVTVLYRRLYRHGQRLAGPAEPGDTPHEFAVTLAERLNRLSPNSRLGTVLSPASREIYRLTDLYIQTLYSPHPSDSRTQVQAIQTWRRLRQRLWLARLYLVSKRPLTGHDR
jgi:hypothetical protein